MYLPLHACLFLFLLALHLPLMGQVPADSSRENQIPESKNIILRGAAVTPDPLVPGTYTLLENDSLALQSVIYPHAAQMSPLIAMLHDSVGHLAVVRKSDGRDLFRIEGNEYGAHPVWIFPDGGVCFFGNQTLVRKKEQLRQRSAITIHGAPRRVTTRGNPWKEYKIRSRFSYQPVAGHQEGMFLQAINEKGAIIRFIRWKDAWNHKWKKATVASSRKGAEDCSSYASGNFAIGPQHFCSLKDHQVTIFRPKSRRRTTVNLLRYLDAPTLRGTHLIGCTDRGFLFWTYQHVYHFDLARNKLARLNQNHDATERIPVALPDSLHLVMTKANAALLQSESGRLYAANFQARSNPIQLQAWRLVSDATGIPPQHSDRRLQYVYWQDQHIVGVRAQQLMVYDLKKGKLTCHPIHFEDFGQVDKIVHYAPEKLYFQIGGVIYLYKIATQSWYDPAKYLE